MLGKIHDQFEFSRCSNIALHNLNYKAGSSQVKDLEQIFIALHQIMLVITDFDAGSASG
jgi:hypothetical protein